MGGRWSRTFPLETMVVFYRLVGQVLGRTGLGARPFIIHQETIYVQEH